MCISNNTTHAYSVNYHNYNESKQLEGVVVPCFHYSIIHVYYLTTAHMHTEYRLITMINESKTLHSCYKIAILECIITIPFALYSVVVLVLLAGNNYDGDCFVASVILIRVNNKQKMKILLTWSVFK